MPHVAAVSGDIRPGIPAVCEKELGLGGVEVLGPVAGKKPSGEPDGRAVFVMDREDDPTAHPVV